MGQEELPRGLLRRRLAWNENGFFLMPDLTHFENLAEALSLKGVKPSPTPLTKHTGRGQRDALDLLSRREATLYRRCVGIIMYIGPDRFDIQFTCKVLSADVSHPSKLSMARLRRAVRYLNGTSCVGIFFKYQDEPEEETVWPDGDWSGDHVTCKSTSAGVIVLGEHPVEFWSVTQQVISLSSAESEFYAIGSGCGRGLLIKSVMQEIHDALGDGVQVRMVVKTDSAAAQAMLHRHGVGRVRHLQTRFLWHQEALRTGQFTVVKCRSDENPADLGTKALDEGRIRRCMSFINIGDAEAFGFPKTAAMQVLAALLLADSLGRVRADDSCVAYFAMGSNDGFYRGLMAGVVAGIFLMIGTIFLAFKLRIVVVARRGNDTKEVAVQGPATYTRWRQDARYQPLPDHSWGAW